MSQHDPPPIADEKLFAQLFDASPFPAVVSRLSDNTVIAINRRTSELFALSQAEAVGQLVTAYYVNPADRAQLAELIRRDGRANNLKVQIRRPDGVVFWALFSARLVNYEGQPAVLTVFTDVSDQVAAEAALRASEQRLASQSNALMALTARYADPDEPFDARLFGILIGCAETLHAERVSMWRFGEGRHAIRCVGLYRLSPRAQDCGALLFRHEYPRYFDALETDRVIAAHDAATDPRTREFRDTYLALNQIGAMLDIPLRQDNTTVGVLCVEHVGGSRAWTIDEQNFTVSAANLIAVAVADEERRKALARLAESEARATMVVNTAHDAFIGIDSQGRIIMWNAQAERIFGWTRTEVTGLTLTETIIPERFREAHESGFQRFHATGEAPVVNQRLELAALHRTGREFPIEITITSPMPIGEDFFFGAFLRDISDRRERDEQLRRAKESAEAATRAKSEFLANMSHELRTPLNGVLGYAQLMQRDRSLSAGQRESLDAIAKCGAHLLDLINDVLDLSKIEAGRIDIERTATDLADLVLDLKYVIADTARLKGLTLTMTVDPSLPRRVVLDGRHLRQVLLNLLGNAVKFTERGSVSLSIRRDEDDRVAFDVTDTGIGIEDSYLEAIFDAFTQTRDGVAAGGTGLGLAISQHLVRRMGDRLGVESTPGQGSRFYFALPLVPGPDSARGDDGDPEYAALTLDARLAPGQHVTALVVDDSTVSRRILASLLESAGVKVITAAGGYEALDLAARHRPDVIFMDLRMSDLDGLEASRRLRRDPSTAAIPIIAVTASAFGDTRQAARDAGCVDHLPKPVRAELLFAALQTHLGVRFVAGEAAAATPPAEASASEITRATSDAIPERTAVAKRLADALAIGNVTDLEDLARELLGGSAAHTALGHRIGKLAADFDFEQLRELMSSLSGDDRPRQVDA